MLMFHFIKRELESIFVHKFSNASMPFFRVFINSSHYWILNGVLIGYFLFHPLYFSPLQNYPIASIFLVILFFVSELMNFCCHIILRNLRKNSQGEKGIPHGFGFGYVSCANYFWETLAWIFFSVLTSCLTSYLFLIVSLAQMTSWALKKHSLYIKEFNGKEGKQK